MKCSEITDDGSLSAPRALWCDDYMFGPNQALSLAMCPEELLLGATGRERIEESMQGVTRPVIEDIDGFGQKPTRGQCYDMNLLMVAASEGSTTILKCWIQEFGMDPNVNRNSELWSPLIHALAFGKKDNFDFLMKVSDIGLPEAAALGMADVVPNMIADYNQLPAEKKWYGLSGEEVALIFSGLSGDVDWVLSLAKACDDFNAGHNKPTGNVVKMAIFSGNVDLVRKLVVECGVILDSPHNLRDPAFWALTCLPMLKFLIEELKTSTLDVLSPSGCSLLESALLDRQNTAAEYLLEQRSPTEWSYLTQNNLLSQSIGKWNCLSGQLLPMINSGNVQEVLRVSLRHARLDIVQVCLEEKGGSLDKTPKKNFCTFLEEAVSSGSVRTVQYVLQNASEELIEYVHSNGYNALVAASRLGREVFEALAARFPNRLNELVWSGMSLLMIAACDCAGSVMDAILDEEFYEAKCRDKVMDANTKCDNGRTALWCAVRSGVVANVEKILQRKEYLKLKELDDAKSINTLFRLASRQTTFASLIACFHHHGMTYTGNDGDDTDATSLAMTAAESGALLQVEDPKAELAKLCELDESVGLSAPKDLLMCEVLRSAPEWAVNHGTLAHLIKECFLDDEEMWRDEKGSALKFRTAYNLALTRCDYETVENFEWHPLFSTANCQRTPSQKAFLAFNGKRKEKMAHPSVTTRRNNFLVWLFRGTKRGDPMETENWGLEDEATPFAMLESLVLAEVFIEPAEELTSDGPRNVARRCNDEQLKSLVQLCAKSCQLENMKVLAEALDGRAALELCDCKGNGGNKSLVHVALGNQTVSDQAESNRLPLIRWLVESGVDLAGTDKEGESALMKSAAMGNIKAFAWIADALGTEALQHRDNHDNNILSFAIKGGRIDIVMRCVEVVGCDACGSHGETALHCAVACGKSWIARYLVEVARVDVHACDASNRSVIDYLQFQDDNVLEEYIEGKTGSKAASRPKTNIQTVQGWLEEVGKKSGSTLRLNQSGLCALEYQGHVIVIELPKDTANLYVYCAFNEAEFDIRADSHKTLFRGFDDGLYTKFCPSIDNKSNDVVISVLVRVAESTANGFIQKLEDFIDDVVFVAERLKAVAAKRYVRQALVSLPSHDPRADEMQDTTKILQGVEEYMVEPKQRRLPLSGPDLSTVKESLQCQLDELNRIIRGGSLRVNEAGQCAFNYEHLTIVLQPSKTPQKLLWTVVLWTVSSDGPITEDLRMRVLKMNYLQTDTKGGTIIETGTPGVEELSFVYEDRVDLPPDVFRNMLENIIDKSLDLHKALRETELAAKEKSSLEGEIRSRKVTLLNAMRLGDYNILDRVLAEAPTREVCDRLEQLALLVLDTGSMDFWSMFLGSMMNRAESTSRVSMEELQTTILKLVLGRDMFSESILSDLIDGKSKFVLDLGFMHHIFSSATLIRKGRAASTAQKVLDEATRKGVSFENDEVHLKKWNNYASTAIYTGAEIGEGKEVITCLEWIFERTKPGDLDGETEVRTLLHQCASSGQIPLVDFMLGRLPHLTLDEECLVWASRQEKLPLVRWILDRAGDSVPRAKAAIVSAAASGSTDILRALGVGSEAATQDEREQNEGSETAPKGTGEQSNEDRKPPRETQTALNDAAKNAIGRGNAEVLAFILEDPRFLGAYVNRLLEDAVMCSDPTTTVETIVASRVARSQAYAMQVPWQAQATAKRKLVLPILQVAKKHRLPEEISALVHSFASPKFEESPIIRSTQELRDQNVLAQLERDLGLTKGTITSRNANDNLVFDMAKIGILEMFPEERTFNLTKFFEFKKGEFQTTAEDLLELSRALPGCFISTTNKQLGMSLRCVHRFRGDGIRYHELRKIVVSFRRCSNAVSSVVSHARKFKLLASVSSLGVFVPEMLQFKKAGRQTRKVAARGRTFSETWFANRGLVLVTTPMDRQAADRYELLSANASAGEAKSDGAFFFMDKRGVIQVGVYSSDRDAANDDNRAALIARAQF
ncbi:expressed unknown protein [Seminavis robusta]|uniref:Uncharacterized protein n=1 Tax=Seminavis robusta TaxID=568900 RepID=A0A9N8E601_9STRA|nr:expressed unknown protein [Seminavis robusta]|eukprot:Sro690_g187590.1 n/a (1992) ;mRNA; f:14045-20172